MAESEGVGPSAYAAFNRGEVDEFLHLLDENVEWRPPFTSVEPEPRQGGEAVRAYLAPDMFEEQAAEPVEEVEEGNRVAARLRARGRGSGIELDQTAFTGPSSAIGPCASRSTSTAEAFAAFSGESETS